MVGARLIRGAVESTNQTPAAVSQAARWSARAEKLMAVAAGLVALCALAIVFGLVNLGRTHETVMQEVARTRSARVATYSLMQGSIDAEAGQRGYLLTGDQRFLDAYEDGRAAAFAHLEELREDAAGEAELRPRIDRATELAQSGFSALSAIIADHEAGTLSPVQLRARLESSKATMDALRAEISALLRQIEHMIDDARAAEQRGREALYWIGGVLALLTLSAVGLTALALRSERRSWNATFQALSDAHAAAEEARESAAASDLAKTRFLAVASHDMRQPLHAITLYLSALERRVENEEAREIIAKMDRATQSMVGMFATLLDLARIQAGVVRPELTSFSLQDVIDRVVAEHPGGGLEAAPTNLTLYSDPALIERVLRNLASNAVKHGGGGARIEASAANGHAEIAVVDHGPGIPHKDQDKVFDEFVRLGAREGLGLGLAIVKRIVDLLGAEIRLASTPGEGARFTLRIPLADAAQSAAHQAHIEAQLDGAPVLVLDDDQNARDAIAGAMRDLGAAVHACEDEQAVERALDAGVTPALMLMDLRINGELQGIDIAARARARLEPAPPVIMLTGDTEPETLARLRASGFAWLIKPVNPRDLSAAAAAQLTAS